MPRPEQSHRREKAVLWPFASFDQFGERTVGYPQEISVRWVPKQREILDKQGNSISLDAQAVVNEQVPIGSLMWLGELQDWMGSSTVSDGEAVPIMEVMSFDRTPDIKNRVSARTLGLMRYRGRLPSTTVLFYDTFIDTNGILLANHSPDMGADWIQAQGSIAIASNQAAWVSGASIAITKVSSPDYEVTADFTVGTPSGSSAFGVILRYEDLNNYWVAYVDGNSSVLLIKREAGVNTTVAVGTYTLPLIEHTMRVVCAYNTLTIYIDGTQRVTYSSATFSRSEKLVGMYMGSVGIPPKCNTFRVAA